MNSNIKKRVCALALCLLALCLGAGAVPPATTALSAVGVVESSLSCRRFTTADGLPQMLTETVWQDSRGYIYIGTLSGFVRYDGLTLTPFLRGRRENIVAFQEVEGVPRALGFVRQWSVDGTDVKQLPVDPQGELLLNNFNSPLLPPGYVLLEDRQSQNRVLCKLEAAGMKRVTSLRVLDDMTPDRKMWLDSTGIYVPTPGGLFRLDKGGAHRLTDKDDVFSLLAVDGTLRAFAADGIYRVERGKLVPECEHTFDAPDYGLAVCPFRRGQLIIADAHTIWLYDTRSAAPLRRLATGFNMIKGLLVDKWCRLWAATYQGAYCFFHCNFENHRLTDRNDIVRAIAATGGHLVMGTLNGKVIVDGKTIADDKDDFYAPGAAIIDDKVYLAGNGDVEVVQGATVGKLGLPQDRYQFVSRYGGSLIIGTRNSVLAYRPENGRLDTLATTIAHPWCAVDDGKGRLWVSGNPGLYCLTGVESGAAPVLTKIKDTPTAVVITAMATDGKGLVCFAVGDTLMAVAGGHVRVMTEVMPMLAMHEVRSLHITRKGHLIAAAVDGLLVARLARDGHATAMHWFDAANGFTTIEPQMSVMAEDADGTVWLAGLEEMTSFSPEDLLSDNQQRTVIEQPRPVWQKWWVWLLVAALLALLVWGVARRYEKRRAQKKLSQLRREKEQKELQLSAVRLKSIPHFNANVLAGIEYFVMNNSTDEAIHYMSLYSDFTSRTLENIDRPASTVAEEVDYVQTYLELERLRYGEHLHYTITVDPAVDRNLKLPTMLLHTYCQNAVKHGIAAKDTAGNVDVAITRESRGGADGVLVAVSDDGVGRAEAAHSSGNTTKQGLKILQQQIEFYNQAAEHKIAQRVTDLMDDHGRPAGTRFEIWVPADFKY